MYMNIRKGTTTLLFVISTIIDNYLIFKVMYSYCMTTSKKHEKQQRTTTATYIITSIQSQLQLSILSTF